ncbi:MAG: NUDIX hydrolase [Aigarchaeota archaeon]|nr:NUDIX hydrolase [Candidatus Geocrenenecus dongiae]
MGSKPNFSREYPLYPIPSVGALIVHGERILIVKRASPPSVGKWSIPGGVIEIGETAEEAVRREVREEVGIDIYDAELLDVYDSITRDENGRVKYHYVIIEYLARPSSLEIKYSEEVLEYRWATLEEITTLDITPSLREILKKHREKIKTYMKLKNSC